MVQGGVEFSALTFVREADGVVVVLPSFFFFPSIHTMFSPKPVEQAVVSSDEAEVL